MAKQILITGGAGFIGSHLTNELIAAGHRIRVLDNLTPQVHGPKAKRPAYLHLEAELMQGDVRDHAAVRRALRGVDAVYHLAARVGVGQSMYEIAEYTSVNGYGTAVLCECLVQNPVERLIVASSMSIYGEGAYTTRDGQAALAKDRTLLQLRANDWDARSHAGEELFPAPTSELKPPQITSVYALSKYDQEQMCLSVGAAYGMSAVALRFWNAYGPNQALSNPYTGVLAIFASRLLNGRPPLINEDGEQLRDFVSVYDIARGCRLALEAEGASGQVFNLASGQKMSVLEVAARVAKALGREHYRPEITGKYRAGDIRHCFADISKARSVLGYEPQVTLEMGLRDLAKWLRGREAEDRVMESRAELTARGLMA